MLPDVWQCNIFRGMRQSPYFTWPPWGTDIMPRSQELPWEVEEALAISTPEGSHLTDKSHIISSDRLGENPQGNLWNRREARMRDDAPSIFKPISIASKALHLLCLREYLHLTRFLLQLSSCLTSLDPPGSFPSQVPCICCAVCKDWSTKSFQEDFHSMEEEDFQWRLERPSAYPLPLRLQQCPSLPSSLPAFFFSTEMSRRLTTYYILTVLAYLSLQQECKLHEDFALFPTLAQVHKQCLSQRQSKFIEWVSKVVINQRGMICSSNFIFIIPWNVSLHGVGSDGIRLFRAVCHWRWLFKKKVAKTIISQNFFENSTRNCPRPFTWVNSRILTTAMLLVGTIISPLYRWESWSNTWKVVK